MISTVIPKSETPIRRKDNDQRRLQTANDNKSTSFLCENEVLFNTTRSTLIHCPISNTGKFIIPSTVTSIGIEAFAQCSGLTTVIIPNSVSSIACLAFSNCTRLTSINIPVSVTLLCYRVFADCKNLTSIYVHTHQPLDLSCNSEVFYRVDKTNCILFVPVGSKTLYSNANQWKDFEQIEELDADLRC